MDDKGLHIRKRKENKNILFGKQVVLDTYEECVGKYCHIYLNSSGTKKMKLNQLYVAVFLEKVTVT
jgi:hypothetical protein